MKIGIDLSPLQNAHRMRGIGSVLRNIINNIPKEHENDTFVFFVLPDSDGVDPMSTLKVGNINYEVRTLNEARSPKLKLPGKLNLLLSAWRQLLKVADMANGDSRINQYDLKDLDSFLQIDPDVALPKRIGGLKKVLFLHDIIPYVLEWEYLWTYQTARMNGFSKKAALRVKARRTLYKVKLKLNTRRADLLIANSHHTKQDFTKYFSLPENIIKVAQLGVSPIKKIDSTSPTTAYKHTSWGYIAQEELFDTNVPFLLFVGGADKRRKLQELIASFNSLRAKGYSIKLVLAGDSMQGPMNIATVEIQDALKGSSYIDDIVFLGFTTDSELQWLYQNALAFTFPSRYEGFGLPILEAMRYGTPVITYDNSAIREVGQDIPLYAKGAADISTCVSDLIKKPASQEHRKASIKRAQEFSWSSTSKQVFNLMS